jgi:endonuclease III
MASSKSSKSILTSQVIDELKTAFPKAEEFPKLPIVESVILAILRENRSLQDSLRALNEFRKNYFDFNELRVSELREIQTIIGHVPDSELRARAIRKFLKQIFQKNYKYDIDGIAKKTFKEAKDDLKDYDALASDFIMAQAQVQTLGGHAFPVDDRILLMARRVGLVEQNADHSTLRGILEKNIPKAQILLAIGLIEEFVESVCTTEAPKCPACRFKEVCPAYEAMLNPPKVKAKEEPKKSGKSSPKTPSAKPSKPVKSDANVNKEEVSIGQANDPSASPEHPIKDGASPSPKATGKPVPKKSASAISSKASPAKASAPSASASGKPASTTVKPTAKSVSPSKPETDSDKSAEKPGSTKPATSAKTPAKPAAKKAEAGKKSTKPSSPTPKKSK